MSKRYYKRRHANGNAAGNENGQDSFLDIVSNVVGILIILVMIAGARVGSIQTRAADDPTNQTTVNTSGDPVNQETSNSNAVVPEKKPRNDRTDLSPEEQKKYIKVCQQFEKNRDNIHKTQQSATELDTQLKLVQAQINGAKTDHLNISAKVTDVKAAIELEAGKKSEKNRAIFEAKRALSETEAQLEEVKRIQFGLQNEKKKTVTVENTPTPFGKKVEGHEAFFVLKGGRISHIPMNVFENRMAGTLRRDVDISQERIERSIGPVEGYTFHFQVSLHQVREGDQTRVMLHFDWGKCLPESDDIGEILTQALQEESKFRQKLSIYLPSTSTITLWVYPDSYNELRTIKKLLIDRGYTIALRPLPQDQPIKFSPNGTSSTSY